MLEMYLSCFDLVIQSYNDPFEGLQNSIKDRPRIIFVDLNMPGLRGDQIIVKLSEKYIFQTTSVFLFTGDRLSEMEHLKLMTLGFDNIFVKPTSQEQMYEAVKSIFGIAPLRQKVA
jgi:DNA-binding response OmpR family regulator